MFFFALKPAKFGRSHKFTSPYLADLKAKLDKEIVDMNISVMSEDCKSFEVIVSMLETLNTVCVDELESQGHTPFCAAMLITVMNNTAELMEISQDLERQMLDGVPFSGDDNGSLLMGQADADE